MFSQRDIINLEIFLVDSLRGYYPELSQRTRNIKIYFLVNILFQNISNQLEHKNCSFFGGFGLCGLLGFMIEVLYVPLLRGKASALLLEWAQHTI